MRRLGIAHALLHALDFVFDVAVGDKNVGPAVVVVVEEETAKTQRDQGGAADFRPRRFIHEQPVALVVIERKHLVGEVGDDDAGMAGAVVVGGVHAHAGAGHAIFAEGDSRRDALLLKGSVVLVQVQLVGLRVVGQQNVGPAVIVVVENGDTEAFGSRV